MISWTKTPWTKILNKTPASDFSYSPYSAFKFFKNHQLQDLWLRLNQGIKHKNFGNMLNYWLVGGKLKFFGRQKIFIKYYLKIYQKAVAGPPEEPESGDGIPEKIWSIWLSPEEDQTYWQWLIHDIAFLNGIGNGRIFNDPVGHGKEVSNFSPREVFSGFKWKSIVGLGLIY